MQINLTLLYFLACDAFIRTDYHAIAMMFVCPSVYLSVWDGHTV